MARAEAGVAGERAQASEFDGGDDAGVLGFMAGDGSVKLVLDVDLEFVSTDVNRNSVEDLDENLERLGADGRGRRSLGIFVGGGGQSSCTRQRREGCGRARYY